MGIKRNEGERDLTYYKVYLTQKKNICLLKKKKMQANIQHRQT